MWRRAFTLTELLVVLAVLVILAALLLPVIGTVGGAARQSVCSNNLRQLGTAWRMYADDHDETYYFQSRWDEEVDVLYLGRHYRTYVRWPFALYPYLRTEAVYRCPADTGPENWRVWAPHTEWYLSYGPNAMIALGYPLGVGGRARRVAEFERPGAVIALAESMTGYACCEDWQNEFFRGANYSGQAWSWDDYRRQVGHARALGLSDRQMRAVTRHGLGNNAVMLDGRARWLRWDAVGDADSKEWRAMLGAPN